MPVVDQNELATSLAFQGRMTQGQALDAVRLLGELVVKAVADGHSVEIPGFGKFDLGQRGDGTPAVRFRQANCVREALKS